MPTSSLTRTPLANKSSKINTVEAYRNDLEGFEQYVREKKIDYKKMNYGDVTDYMIHLSNSNMKPASINPHLVPRSFYFVHPNSSHHKF